MITGIIPFAISKRKESMPNGVKTKPEKQEAAIKRLESQMGKLEDREWSPIAYAKLVTYAVEAHGAKFPNKEARDSFTETMTDSDWGFSSNMKKYFIDRGFLPAKNKVAQSKYE